MALASYSDLQSAVASFLHRTDLTTEIKDFIALAEADLQVRAKLSQWDTSTSVTITSGAGSLPGDFAAAIAVVYGSDSGALQYINPGTYDSYAAANSSGDPLFYTIRGSELRVTPSASGTAALNYTARFTALSDSATNNSLLALFPDAYLHGTLMHACSWLADDAGLTKYAALFEQAVKRIRKYMNDYKYPQGLVMRAA